MYEVKEKVCKKKVFIVKEVYIHCSMRIFDNIDSYEEYFNIAKQLKKK